MTVKEMIEKLQEMDPDLEVFVRGYEGGYNRADVSADVETYYLNVHTA